LNLPAISSSCAYLNYNFEALLGELLSFGYLTVFKNGLFLYSGLCPISSGIKRLLNQSRRNLAWFSRRRHFSFANSTDNYAHVMIQWPLSQQIRQQLLVVEAGRKNQEPSFRYELFGYRFQNFV
jgi:hypothetical protein